VLRARYSHKTCLFLTSVTFTIFPVLNMVEYETRERTFKIQGASMHQAILKTA